MTKRQITATAPDGTTANTESPEMIAHLASIPTEQLIKTFNRLFEGNRRNRPEHVLARERAAGELKRRGVQ